MEIRTEIRKFLAKFFQNLELKDDEDIFALGFVNSLFAMQLVLFIEKTFGVTVENEDLDLANFRTIDAQTRFIQRKQGAVTVS